MFIGQPQFRLPNRIAEGRGKRYGHRNLRRELNLEQLGISQIFPKLVLGGFFAIFLLGAQPAINLPTIKQATVVKAEVSQTQSIGTASIPFSTQWPFSAIITQYFSSGHPALDLASGIGTPIHPIAEGTVESAGYSLVGYGLNVVINHGNGYKSLYAHMGQIYVQVGQTVDKGSILGVIGMTGHTTGPHTHLEVSKDGVRINPLTILPGTNSAPQSAKPAAPVKKVTKVAPVKKIASAPASTTTPTPTPTVKKEYKKTTDLSLVITTNKKPSNLDFAGKYVKVSDVASDTSNYIGGSIFDLKALLSSFSYHHKETTDINEAIKGIVTTQDLKQVINQNAKEANNPILISSLNK